MHKKLPPRCSVTQFSRAMYNETVDMIAWWHKQKRSQRPDPRKHFRQSGLVRVQNNSREDLPWLGIVGLDTPLYSYTDDVAEFSVQPTFNADVADDGDHIGQWGVLWEPLGRGEIGWACVSGLTPTKVYVYEDVPGYADVRPGATSDDRFWPAAAQYGAARILWKEAGTGFAWALLRLGDANWERTFECKDAMPTSGAVTAGQQATAHPLKTTGVVDTTAAREFEVYDERGEFRSRAPGILESPNDRGSFGIARWSHAARKWFVQSIQPHALRISGETSADVYYDDTEFTATATPVIMNPTGAIALHDYTTADLIKNPLELQYASGDTFHAEWNEKATTPQWEAVDVGRPRPHRISGETSAVVYYDDTEFTATATPVIMNPVDAISEEDYTVANLIKNPLELQYASGDTFHAEWNEKATTPQWEAVDVGRPRPHRISGETSAVVYYDDTEFTATATPVIMNPVDAISEEDYTVANLIKNPLELQYASGDTFHAEWNITEEQWEAVGPTSTFQARWLLFTASAPFLTGGTITIDARTYYDGEDPAADVTSILNPLNLTGYNNCTGIAIINTKVSPPTYTAVNVSPVAEDIVTDFQVDTSNNELETKARSISIMPRGDESAWGVAPGYKHTGDDCT